jgi:2-haloalkanoic acid dehalogenase type II
MQNPSQRDGIRAVAFDCYGTLIDFTDVGFKRIYHEICVMQSLGCDGIALWEKWMDIWRRMSPMVSDYESPRNEATSWTAASNMLAFRPYRAAWPEHFEACFRELGVTGDGVSAYEHVRNNLAGAPAFEETAEVLATLKTRYRIGILSNADDDFLNACLEKNGLHTEFEVIVTSESAGFYKPREDIFHSFCEVTGLQRHEVLYVGDSQSADVLGAKNAGMPVAWLNRDGASLKEGVPQPDHEIASLCDLLDLLP